MNWRLIAQLSLFGMAMGVATVFLIPSSVEPFFWLVIFVTCAYIYQFGISRAESFLHGLMVSVLNSVWITAAHVLLFDRYIANHPQEAAMMASMPFPHSPRLMMLIMGPLIGVASGLVLGLFSVIASKLVARRRPAAIG